MNGDMSFIGASMEHGARLTEQDYASYPRDYVACGGVQNRPETDSAAAAADFTQAGPTASAHFPPFHKLPKRGEPLEVIAARPASGKARVSQAVLDLTGFQFTLTPAQAFVLQTMDGEQLRDQVAQAIMHALGQLVDGIVQDYAK